MNLADNIKKVARKHGITLKEISSQMGVLPNNLSRKINSPHISLENMENIARVIGCEVGEFFHDEPTSQGNEILCPHCGKPIMFSKPDTNKKCK